MFLKTLEIKDFRNIENLKLDLNENFNVLWGNNAQGKTNILEAIYLLANLKSFRTSKNENYIKHGKSSANISSILNLKNVEHIIKLCIEKNGKKTEIDGKKINKISDFIGKIAPVVFSPEELNIVKGSPVGRRSIIDRAIFQIENSYLDDSLFFIKYLKNRNALLKNEERNIEVWDEGFIKYGAKIIKKRINYITRLNPLIDDCFKELTSGKENAEIKYPVSNNSEEEIKANLRIELQKNCKREKIYKQTLSGPHRDDPEFLINGYPLRIFGSQGQQRSFILAFKTAQIIDLQNIKGINPILLLDDMTSELDNQRQSYFFNFLEKQKGQVFITTTDINMSSIKKMKNSFLFNIRQGEIYS